MLHAHRVHRSNITTLKLVEFMYRLPPVGERPIAAWASYIWGSHPLYSVTLLPCLALGQANERIGTEKCPPEWLDYPGMARRCPRSPIQRAFSGPT